MFATGNDKCSVKCKDAAQSIKYYPSDAVQLQYQQLELKLPNESKRGSQTVGSPSTHVTRRRPTKSHSTTNDVQRQLSATTTFDAGSALKTTTMSRCERVGDGDNVPRQRLYPTTTTDGQTNGDGTRRPNGTQTTSAQRQGAPATAHDAVEHGRRHPLTTPKAHS